MQFINSTINKEMPSNDKKSDSGRDTSCKHTEYKRVKRSIERNGLTVGEMREKIVENQKNPDSTIPYNKKKKSWSGYLILKSSNRLSSDLAKSVYHIMTADDFCRNHNDLFSKHFNDWWGVKTEILLKMS